MPKNAPTSLINLEAYSLISINLLEEKKVFRQRFLSTSFRHISKKANIIACCLMFFFERLKTLLKNQNIFADLFLKKQLVIKGNG